MRISGRNGISAASRGLQIKMIPSLMPDKTPANKDMESYCSMLVRPYFLGKTDSGHDLPLPIGNRSSIPLSFDFVRQ
jgi:hypothetical protein